MPVNTTAATAIDINTLNAAYVTGPRLITESFTVPTITDLWFMRTAVPTEVTMGWAMASSNEAVYSPVVSIFTGTPSALVPYLSFSNKNDANDLNIPEVAGTTYYFQVTNALSPVTPTTVTLSITATYGPRYSAPLGSLIVNADADSIPTALVDVTGAVPVLQFFALESQVSGPFTEATSGAQLADGTFMIANQDTNHPEIYNGTTLQLITAVTGVTVPGMVIGSDRGSNFYVAAPAGTTVYKISKAGVVSGTTYGPLATAVAALQAKADDSVLYYHAAGSVVVRTWTTATNLAGADLAAAVATYNTKDFVVMNDGSIVVAYDKSATDVKLNQYSAAGATVHSWTLDTTSFFRIAVALDDPVSVWVWFRQASTTNRFERITLSTGAASKTLNIPVNAAGVVPAGSTFGIEGTCLPPLLMLGATSAAGGGPEGTGGLPSLGALPGMGLTDPIRVVRRWQLPFETNLQVFCSRLEILIQSGVGLTAGPSGSPVQGEDPTIMLRISKDGGKTWGNEQWRGMGKIGEYLARPYWNRLGRGRNLVAEIVCTDPVFVAFLDAFVDAEVGSS